MGFQLAERLPVSRTYPTSEGNAHRHAVQIDPDQEEWYYHIGVLLMESDPARAEKAFAETVRVNPENFKARNNLGLVLMSLSRDAEAEAQFRAALQLNPGDRRILEN